MIIRRGKTFQSVPSSPELVSGPQMQGSID
jgi:hypothetical protein